TPWHTTPPRSCRSRCSVCTRCRACGSTSASCARRPRPESDVAVDRVRIAAHAKLNLLLRILAREAPSGYHQIETAFALLELADELVVTRASSGVALTVHGPDLGPPEANLAVRAARARGRAADRHRHPGRLPLVGRAVSRARRARAGRARRRGVHGLGQRRQIGGERLRDPRLRQTSGPPRTV